jgi:hypothetical protein
MKKNILLLATIAVLASSLPVASNAATQVYDLKADWSDTQNPNGPWSFRDAGGGLFVSTPFPWVDSAFSGAGITKITEASILPGYEGFSPVEPGYLEVGDVALIPFGPTSVRWTTPVNGIINLSGALWEGSSGTLHGSSDELPWALTHNGNPVSDGDGLAFGVSSRSSPYDLSSGSAGTDGLLNISVHAGDQIDLGVEFGLYGSGGLTIGINFTITLTSDSVDPVAAIEDLALAVVEMNLQNGIENSLDSKLDAALNALGDANENDDVAVCNSLAAFINAVEAQRGNKLTNAQADQLIASAQEIQALLNCGD